MNETNEQRNDAYFITDYRSLNFLQKSLCDISCEITPDKSYEIVQDYARSFARKLHRSNSIFTVFERY